jgi:hypothetical protein
MTLKPSTRTTTAADGAQPLRLSVKRVRTLMPTDTVHC